jgi:pimeloyl-ACP methyl ester carboxylesterase
MAVVPRSTIDSKGTTISYLDFGGVGQLIVLLHGLAGRASEWTDTAIALTGRGHVIAPDLRGHGHSDRLPRDVSPEAHTRDVVKLIQHLHGGPIKLIGQSFGGLVAYLVAATHPALVKGLVVVEAGVSKPRDEERSRTINWLRSWPVPFESRETAEGFFKGRGDYGRTWASLLEPRVDGLWPAFNVDAMERTLAAIPDYGRQWARVQCRTLVVAGADSSSDKAELAEMAEKVGGEYEAIPDASHDVHLEAPQQWMNLLKAFLDGL